MKLFKSHEFIRYDCLLTLNYCLHLYHRVVHFGTCRHSYLHDVGKLFATATCTRTCNPVFSTFKYNYSINRRPVCFVFERARAARHFFLGKGHSMVNCIFLLPEHFMGTKAFVKFQAWNHIWLALNVKKHIMTHSIFWQVLFCNLGYHKKTDNNKLRNPSFLTKRCVTFMLSSLKVFASFSLTACHVSVVVLISIRSLKSTSAIVLHWLR